MGRQSKKYRAKLTAHTAQLIATTSPVEIKCELGEDGQPKGPPTFSGLGYSGGMVPGYTATPKLPYPYVIDLAGTKNARHQHANLDHKGAQRVGHLTKVDNDGKQLAVEGLLSAATAHRDEVANSARDGMPWEVSIECNLGGSQLVPKGKSATVNGQTFQGPFFRMTKNTFTGLAFVSHGADDGNAVKVAASTAGEKNMDPFQQFVAACGLDFDAITDEQKATLHEAFEAKGKLAKGGNGDTIVKSFEDVVAENRAKLARQQKIQAMAGDAMKAHPLSIDQIEHMAKLAMEADTDPERFELELLRNTRTQSGRFQTRSRIERDPQMIECALSMSSGLPNIEKYYPEEVLNAVDRAGMKHFSLQGLLIQVASENGYVCRAGERIHNGNVREILEYCFPPVHARLTGFSTFSLPGILGNVANKEILAGYMEQDTTWTEIATVKSVSNFHAHTSYRLLDNLEYDEIGPTGEIHHGVISEESYTRQAKTYAKMLGITRTDIINDDLSAFDDIRERLGRGAAKKFNNVFWAAFINNSSFFTVALTNFLEGATTTLLTDGVGLQLGVTAYRQMRSPAADGSKRMGASMGAPRILLVPPQLEFAARRFYQSMNLQSGVTTSMPDANIFAGLYRPVVQDRLSDSSFTGYSTTAWYLFGDSLKPMVVSFLNGQRTPTVESADADFNQLGIQFRGVHDFGCDKSEYMAGLKVKGAA